MKKNIVLIGMPGAGKSTIGVILAKVLGKDFIDADLVIQKQEGRLLKEIIREEGPDGFLEIEDRVNAGLNGLSNCTFIAGDVLKVIDGLTDKPDLIVLDPPRDGIHPKALQKIIDFGVERIVYISCKPTSLARDLELLQGRGYQVEKAVGVDMFAGTGHVETVCLLSRKAQ